MPTITACVSLYNDEEMLPRCLDSIKDVVDDIIVMDNESQDKSVEVARRYTDKVYSLPRLFQWYFGHDAMKNQCVQLASGDFILQIDTDEVLHNPDVLLRTVRDAKDSDIAWLVKIPFMEKEKGADHTAAYDINNTAKNLFSNNLRLLDKC